MKTPGVTLLIISALIVTGSLSHAAAQDANARKARNESGVVQFNEPVKLLDVILKGEYLFVHHQGMMERGKPCAFVYRHDQGKPGGFVTSFHCQPVTREKTTQFKVAFSRRGNSDLPVIEEIQFAASNQGHRVHN
jgi:hypothetical protein